jgi:hypothetical protein
MEKLMRLALALLAILAVASCQSYPTATAPGWRNPVAAVSGTQVQRDVAAIVQGMEQARNEGLRRAAGR